MSKHSPLVIALLLMCCFAPVLLSAAEHPTGSTNSLALTATAFSAGGAIPKQYTCEGADLSPALAWTNVPSGTQSLALIVDDPDAPVGTFTHWIIWNIPATSASLPERVAKTETLSDGARQGTNSFRRIGYSGPCPPPGKPHRYFFRLYALGAVLNTKAGASRKDLEQAMHGHRLSEAQLMGTFGR